MKKTTLIATLGLVTLISITGCKHKGVNLTEIPGPNRPAPTGLEPSGKLPSPRDPENTTGIGFPEAGNGAYDSTIRGPHDEDVNKFAEYTVHFDTDSAAIKKDDRAKLEHVAEYFKNNSSKEALRVEGNADERGTEQYNIALGDKRALAVREYLAHLGVDSQRIATVSNGEAKPIDPARNDAAYHKNRRAEMVLLIPK
jgi:outer membrane protein OmpA-like peptidoglycan-associated protein